MVGIFGSGHDLDLSINHAYASVARNAAEFDGITEIPRRSRLKVRNLRS